MKPVHKSSVRNTMMIWAALALAACGTVDPGAGNGNDGTNPTPTPAHAFDSQQAGFAAGQLKSGAEENAAFYAFDPTSANAAGSFGLPTSCDPVVSGDAGDPDNDGFPNDVSASYDCSVGTVVNRGQADFRDTLPNEAAFAFHAFAETELAVDGDVSNRVTATIDADENAGTYELDATDVEVSTSVASADITSSVSGNSYMSFTPNGAWAPYMGEVTDGELVLDADWAIEVTGAASVSADVTTIQPLQLDPTCPTQIVGGEIEGSADIQAQDTSIHEEFHIKWSDCDDAVATYNGDAVALR